jgi:dTDP-4-amino-4,6-dideoxygalactose transaminase
MTIGKGATDPDHFHHRSLFYHAAREGFGDLLAHVLRTGRDNVLLPAFIGWSPREGSGVFDPVRASPAKAVFYDLNPDLTVDLKSLEQALGAQPGGLLVVIHYFGRTQPHMAAIRKLADRHQTLLIEDLAHGFYSWAIGGAAGRWGHAALFSLHKMLPRGDGGMMLYRDASLLTGQQETAPELARFLLDYDWFAIAAARRANFMAITEQLWASPHNGKRFELLWPGLSPSDVPQTLPVRILAGDRDAIYHRMNEAGFGMTSLYHTLIEEVRKDFPAMGALSRTIINFPVHQDVDPAAIDGLIQAFERSLDA